MNVKTEVLSAEKVNQSNIETKIYDGNAQFYDYDEFAKHEPKNRSGKRIILSGSLIVFGVFCLFGSLAAAFYYLSEGLFRTATVNEVKAKNLENEETGDKDFGKTETEQNGSEIEKTVKPNLSETDFVKKESVNEIEKKPTKIIEQNEKNPLPSPNSKELPKTVSTNLIDSNSKNTDSDNYKQSVRNNEKRIIQNEVNRQSFTNLPLNKTFQNRQTPRQNRIDPQVQDLPPNKRELVVKKIKQSNPEQRSKFIDRLQNRRRKN